MVPGSIEGTEGFERLGDLANMDNKEKANSAMERKQSNATDSYLSLGKKLVPIQRYGKGTDIANTALFLASPAASYMSGSNIVIDGGATLTSPNMMFFMPAFVEKWSSAKL